MSFQLRVMAGPDTGLVFNVPTGKSVLLGRGREADLQVNDPSVSRAHCRVGAKGAESVVEDLGSRSGVLLNGERVTEHPLRHLDIIQIGTTQFRIEFPTPVESSTLSPGFAPAPARPPLVLTQARPPVVGTQARPDPLVPQPAVLDKGDKPPPLPAERLDELTGFRFGTYLIGPMLAKGQSGPMFKATDTRNNQPVALKVLWPEFSSDDQEVKRFVRAMKTMLPVQHPHLVSLYGAGKNSGYCWIAMEFIDGESLAQVLKKCEPANRLDWKDALRVGIHINRALVFAHHRRIVHRNITPPNILIRSADGTAKLGDLMLSKALEGSLAGHITSKGQLLGDLHYLAPERTSSQIGEVDERSDLYSLGATLYTALTGRPPLQGKSMMETILKIRQEKPAPPRTLEPTIPAELDQIVMKMMAKDPNDRYQKAAEVLVALQQFATSKGVPV